eukprot:1157079-Pelagomonas_calceolata.AAC.4
MVPLEEGEGEEPPMVPEPERDEGLELPSRRMEDGGCGSRGSLLGAWGEQCRRGKQAWRSLQSLPLSLWTPQPQLPAEEGGTGEGKGAQAQGSKMLHQAGGQGAQAGRGE